MTVIAISLAALLVLGVPIAFAFGLSAVIALLWTASPLLNVASKMFASVDSFVLLAAPFYIVAGELINRGGISDRLIQLSILLSARSAAAPRMPRSFGHLFSGISGTAVADMAALGQMFINGMPREGYSSPFAAALITAASVIGPIIPPSVIMVLYAAVADVSVLNLFIAGFVPGLLLAASLAAVVFYKGVRGQLPVVESRIEIGNRSRVLRDGLLVASLPGFIIFGTLSGVFTPTEAGGIAVIYAIFLGVFVFRHLDLNGIITAMRNAARLTAALFLMIAAVEIANYVLILEGVEQATANLVSVFMGFRRFSCSSASPRS